MKLRRMTPLIHRCTSLLVGTALALAVGSALSVTLDISGVKVEDTLTIYNNKLVLNGAGVVFSGKAPQYVAHIYAKSKFNHVTQAWRQPGSSKRLVLTAIKEVDTAPIVKMFNRSVEATASRTDMAKLIPGLVNIGNIFKANTVLKSGEIMTVDWIPITGMVIYVGTKMQGNPMREPEFFRAAMAVWMGDSPADAQARAALLGQI